MKELCVIHAGMPKTGSTSIQTALFKNLSENPEADFSSPPLPGHRIFSLFSSDFENYHGNIGHHDLSSIEKQNEETATLLINDISDKKCKKYIISSEDIYHMDIEGLKRMKSFFSPFFKHVVITGYVRPPRSFLQSAFQQLVKFHEVDTINPRTIYHPYIHFKRFDQVFGEENVFLKVFYPSHFPENSVLRDFEKTWDLTFSPSISEVRENESISQNLLSILFFYNKSIQKKHGFVKDYFEHSNLIEKLRLKFTGSSFKFSKEYMENVYSIYKEDLEWIDERLGVSLKDFDDNSIGGITTDEELLECALDNIPKVFELIQEQGNATYHDIVLYMIDLLKEKTKQNKL